MANCTYIHGIASSEAIDTAGEIVDLAGLDCSSFVGSALNWEHKSDVPGQIVGKVLEFKKIFSEKDCEKDEHKFFWDKCQTPFLYVMGRLFDDKKDSAKECAALFLDDHQNPNEVPMVGFSIEGSKIPGAKDGIRLTRSIARKLTITNCPANKTCVAQMIASPEAQSKSSSIDDIFKSEDGFVEIPLFKAEKLEKDAKILQFPKPAGALRPANQPAAQTTAPQPQGDKPALKPTHPQQSKALPQYAPIPRPDKMTPTGSHIGDTSSGKPVFSHQRIHEYNNFSSQDHRDAAAHHQGEARRTLNDNAKSHHFDRMKMHLQAATTQNFKETRLPRALEQVAAQRKVAAGTPVAKALTAGSGMAAPNQLAGGAVLAKASNKEDATFYHGTRSNFDKFTQKGSGKHGPGFYFTPDKNEAKGFAHTLSGEGKDGDEKVFHANLSVSKPFNTMSVEHAKQAAKYHGFEYKEPKFAGGSKEHYHHLEGQMKEKGLLTSKNGQTNFNDKLKEAGFDHVHYDLMGHKIVFDPDHVHVKNKEVVKNKPFGKSESLEKGLKGDWEKEGYRLSHNGVIDHGKYNKIHIKAHSPQGDVVGSYIFIHEKDSKHASPLQSNTFVEHQRKGLANSAYSQAQKELGVEIKPKEDIGAQTSDAKKLWSNPNRTFGKSEWLARATEEYSSWDKKAQFEQFMSSRMPHLTKGEIAAFGQTLALKKTLSMEGALADLANFGKREDQIQGGLADKKQPKDFDPEQLAAGIKVEMEHTSDKAIAEEIAMDHLTEDKDYYKKLATIEKK